MNATLTMVGVPRPVPTPLALLCAAVEVDSNLQAMDWTVMVWHCYQRVEGGRGEEGQRKWRGQNLSIRHTKYCRVKPQIKGLTFWGDNINSAVVSIVELLLEVQIY